MKVLNAAKATTSDSNLDTAVITLPCSARQNSTVPKIPPMEEDLQRDAIESGIPNSDFGSVREEVEGQDSNDERKIVEVDQTETVDVECRIIPAPKEVRNCRESTGIRSRASSSWMFGIGGSKDFTELLQSAKMKAERAEAFFFNNGMTVALAGLFFALNVIVAAHAAHQFTAIGGFTTADPILRVTLPIARVGGRLVTFNCAWLLLTGCKYTWTLIRTHVVPIVPIGIPIDEIMPKYHRCVALWIIFFGNIVHALPQLLNYASGAMKMKAENKLWPLKNAFTKRQLLLTGILLLLIFTMFFLTTLKAFRKTAAGFRCFWWFHMGGIALAYPLLILHGTCKGNHVFLFAALAPLLLYLFDVVMRRSKVATTKVLEWKTHSDEGQQITELIMECPPNFVYIPGQHAELKFEPISAREWHPFTIASAPKTGIRICDGKRVKVLIFFIKNTGRWTESLFNFASTFDQSKATKPTEISIRGPHGSPSANFFEYKHIIMIGSGVGITPLLSVWQHMVDQRRSRPKRESIIRRISNFLARNSSESIALPKHEGDSLRTETRDSSFSSACSKVEVILESLAISIGHFGFFLTAATAVIVTQIIGYYTEVATMEVVLASISLIVHTAIIFVSAFAHNRSVIYFHLPKCWIEICIILIDTINLWLSISCVNQDNPVADRDMQVEGRTTSTRWIVRLCSTSVFLHTIRIFHIFYATLKSKTEQTRQQQRKNSTIQGILINRNFAGMRFCIDHLLHPLEEGMSKELTLQSYGTRENADTDERSNVFSLPDSLDRASSRSKNHSYSFHTGRPAFESIFRKAIHKAHKLDPDSGEIIGVFFCGSPAIGKCLHSSADKVNTEHQFLTKTLGRKPCKIVIHVESF